MSLTDRDKKLVMILLPVVLLAGYWFLILAPQRNQVTTLDQQVATAESARDESVANQQRLSGSRNRYASDYETVVRLGKAIPSTLDMPSLLVQLEAAAKGTGIDFDSITVGQRATAATATSSSSSGSSSGTPPVASGGEQAKTGSGKATEQANGGADTANKANETSGGTNPSSGQASGSPTAASPVAGLDTVPLNFSFEGSYFDLAEFLHSVKRFVRVANDDIKVKGRLMTVDGLSLTTEKFPKIKAQLTATIYLSPKSQGATGGGTAQGPTATPASSATPASGSPSNTTAPTQSTGEPQQ